MSFKEKPFLVKAFVECQVKVISVYEFQTKLDSYEDSSWALVWSCVSLWFSNKSQFLRRQILDLRLKLRKLMSFKPKWILPKTFFQSQCEVLYVYQFQTKGNSYQDICSVPVCSYLSLRVSNNSESLSRHLLSLSLKLYKFMSFKQKEFLLKAFVECQVELI